MTNTANEKRIEKMARQAAKVVGRLRASGERAAAERFARAAMEVADEMRAGRM